MRRLGTVLAAAVAVAMALLGGASAAEQRLPDGGVAEAAGQGAIRAWYGDPTGRYGHGVLGDAIEAASLVVVDHTGRRHVLRLGDDQVFEDITPRLADLDADGANEVVTIRTDVGAGAAVAVYGVRDGRLIERAASAPIGTRHRWLSIAAIADFTGDGRHEVAIVKTPHIGGVLEVLALSEDRLVGLYAPARGYTTHIIGARILTLAAAGDLTGDGIAELALPDQGRRRLHVLSLRDGVETLLIRDLAARIDGQVRILGPGMLALPLETGETEHVRLP